jgi:hypothetical protein
MPTGTTCEFHDDPPLTVFRIVLVLAVPPTATQSLIDVHEILDSAPDNEGTDWLVQSRPESVDTAIDANGCT